MKRITIKQNDIEEVEKYLKENEKRPIIEVYKHIKSIPVFKRRKVEHLVFTYLYINRKKLGIK